MRCILIAVTALTTVATLHAQDRIVTLSYVSTPTLIEIPVSGTSLGSSVVAVPLPRHSITNDRPELVPVAGGRFVAWMAQISHGLDCHAVLAVHDRRTQQTSVVPRLEYPCGTARLVADSRRPRLFVHRFAAIFGIPGHVGVVDETFTYRPLIVGPGIGTAFAYASDVGQLFITRVGTPDDPLLKIIAIDVNTGAELKRFSVADSANKRENQLVVTPDGRIAYLYQERFLRRYDVTTGTLTATSPELDLGHFWWNAFELDEARNLILFPARESPSYNHHLLALDATTLAIMGEGNAGGYGPLSSVRPLQGRGDAAAYLVSSIGGDPKACSVWVDAIDGSGVLRARADLVALSGLQTAPWYGCPSTAVLLSRPAAPTNLTSSVQGRRVTINWTNPSNMTGVELEAGFSSGRRDLAILVGPVANVAFDDVPPGIYYVRVRATNEIGSSPPSGEIAIVVP